MGVLSPPVVRLRPDRRRRETVARGGKVARGEKVARREKVARGEKVARPAGVRARLAALGRLRPHIPAPGLVPAVTVALVAMIAVAVSFQAQRVAGQDRLEEVRLEVRDAGRQQAELRAAVAEAEAPAQVLDAAFGLGMVEPAPAVAVAAPAPVAPATEPVGRR